MKASFLDSSFAEHQRDDYDLRKLIYVYACDPYYGKHCYLALDLLVFLKIKSHIKLPSQAYYMIPFAEVKYRNINSIWRHKCTLSKQNKINKVLKSSIINHWLNISYLFIMATTVQHFWWVSILNTKDAFYTWKSFCKYSTTTI